MDAMGLIPCPVEVAAAAAAAAALPDAAAEAPGIPVAT